MKIRYPVSSILMVFGMIVCILSILIGMELFDNYNDQKKESAGFTYALQVELLFETNDSLEDIMEQLNELNEVNIKLENTSVYVNEIDETKQCHVVLRSDITQKYPMVWGTIPNLKGEYQVAIGRSLLEYTIDDGEDKYIILDGEKYLVTGVVGAQSSDMLDNVIILNIDTISEKLREKYCTDDIYYSDISIQSDSRAMIDDINKMINNGMQAEILDVYMQSSELYISQESNNLAYICIYGFSIIFCVVVSVFYMEQRQREVSVKKTFGYSSAKILFNLVGVLIAQFLTAVLISLILFGAFNFFMYENPYQRVLAMSDIVVDVIGLFLVTIFAVIIFPVARILNCPPSQGTKLKGGV